MNLSPVEATISPPKCQPSQKMISSVADINPDCWILVSSPTPCDALTNSSGVGNLVSPFTPSPLRMLPTTWYCNSQAALKSWPRKVRLCAHLFPICAPKMKTGPHGKNSFLRDCCEKNKPGRSTRPAFHCLISFCRDPIVAPSFWPTFLPALSRRGISKYPNQRNSIPAISSKTQRIIIYLVVSYFAHHGHNVNNAILGNREKWSKTRRLI